MRCNTGTIMSIKSGVCLLVLGRCRYFVSVSVFGFLVGFYKSRFGFRYRFFKISDIGSVFRFFASTDNASSEQ